MCLSGVFDLLSVGIGPSSSHTVGPMRAAHAYLNELLEKDFINKTCRLQVELYGSLALTGIGHKTDVAILMGLEGHLPETIQPEIIESSLKRIRQNKKINLLNNYKIAFDEKTDLILHKDKVIPYHSNAMRFIAFDQSGEQLFNEIIYSIGGGFIVEHRKIQHKTPMEKLFEPPYPFSTCDELLAQCEEHNLSIDQLMLENEKSHHIEKDIHKGIENLWEVMQESVENGCKNAGYLPW